ncbi:MAG TPA: enoyl-CoA hydratase-related protein, partial [Nevskiaceae bacterium]|nr:enoyl-CoA hydratase-related protein [Nevskiaceae bacterium]
MAAIDYTLDDGIAVITVNNPPVNALSQAVRAGLLESFTKVDADPAIRGAVVIGADRTFVAGADIREFGKPLEPPEFPPILAAIEASTKPIVAALHGTALGGGLELALACHFRVAIASAQCGLPEVNLGLLPGAGGTQRLPRLVGGEKGLDMILSGKPARAAEALSLGIVDEIVDGTDQPALLRGALAFVRKVIAEKRPLKLARTRTDKVAGTGKAFFDEVRKKNANKWRGQLAPFHIVDCVEAACTLPTFDEGVAVERKKFFELLDSPQSAAMRHIFFAEREAARVPDVPKETLPKKIGSVAIIGAGTMGGGIAMACANAGLNVLMSDAGRAQLDAGLARIHSNYET